MSYRRALEEEEKQKEIDKQIAEQIEKGVVNSVQVIQEKVHHEANDKNTTEGDVINTDKVLEQANGNNSRENKEKLINDIDAQNSCTIEIKKEYLDLEEDKSENTNDDTNTNNDVTIPTTEDGKESKKSDVTVNNDKNDENDSDSSEDNAQKLGTEVRVPVSQLPVILPDGVMIPPPKVETVDKDWKSKHLTYEEVNEYCQNLFKFKTINIKHFK